MDASERRKAILQLLASSGDPVTGSSLAQELGVTRQVIVQDITVLRAQGHHILATPRGYTLVREQNRPAFVRLVAVKHDRHRTREELYTIVDAGVEVVDVIVDHPVYGQLTGQLALSTREQVDAFIDAIEKSGAGLLSSLTDGTHLHTLRASDKTRLAMAVRALGEKGFLLSE